MFTIQNLSIRVQETTVVQEVSCTLLPGTITALMGSNGSGKSSLSLAIAGHPHYSIIQGQVYFEGIDILQLSAEERARKGIFVAFQQAPTIPGVLSVRFLKEAYQAIKGVQITLPELLELVNPLLTQVGLSPATLERAVHEGFSGGEKKRWELLQVLLLKPKIAILDEIDSGLDIDGLKLVAVAIEKLKKENPSLIVVVITHYPRLLEYLKPNNIHIMDKGSLVASGGVELIYELEQRGYNAFQTTQQI